MNLIETCETLLCFIIPFSYNRIHLENLFTFCEYQLLSKCKHIDADNDLFHTSNTCF